MVYGAQYAGEVTVINHRSGMDHTGINYHKQELVVGNLW